MKRCMCDRRECPVCTGNDCPRLVKAGDRCDRCRKWLERFEARKAEQSKPCTEQCEWHTSACVQTGPHMIHACAITAEHRF